jgi:hypothetical protein
MEVTKTADIVNHIDDVAEQAEKHHHHHPRPDDASSIRSEALGDDLPNGYFYSVQFLGAMAVSLPPLRNSDSQRNEWLTAIRDSASLRYQHTSSSFYQQTSLPT